LVTVFIALGCVAIGAILVTTGYVVPGAIFVLFAIVIASALKMANTWQKFVILRAGKLRGVKAPGLFLIIPAIDNVVAVIDERIQTTAFSAEEALTKDTVPVNVDAIIFWFVHDAQKAALNITNYREAIDRVAQTSLREMIGSSMLSALLSERTTADELLRGEIGRKTADWGISVKSARSATSRFRWPCRTRCLGKRRPSGKSRRASSSDRPKPRSLANSSRRRRSMRASPQPCNSVP